ncbi:MAG: adenylate/guanylate cyclase domain-containing protein [Candidatus Eremiobacteraeota bacterium]|nr:adenylate/guanylate cyclase domain-containing protein [Candidatus Eremiobacteraeota bacterium]
MGEENVIVNPASSKNRFDTLGSIVNVINSTLDIRKILELIMDNALELMEAERGFIMMVDQQADILEFKIARNLDRKKLESDELAISRTIVKEVFSGQKAVLTHNAAKDPRYKNNPSVKAFGLRSVICVPLLVKGECLGVIYLDNRFKKGIFQEEDLDFMCIFAHEIALALENAKLEQEKAFIREVFTHYVSPEVAEEIIKRGSEYDLQGEKREVTVFFADIRGFSTISEAAAPHDLFSQLNEFFEEMIAITFRKQGTFLKFLGDGFMVAFGAPLSHSDDAIRAVQAAMEMRQHVELLNRKWEKEGRPPFLMGIGIHTGEAMVGNVGCRQRREYTVIGDVPNTASRLENMNKEFQSTIILSEATYRKVRDFCTALPRGPVTLRGKTEPVSIYVVP